MTKNKIKITLAKGRPMLHWVGKKPLDYVKGFPAQLVEVFDSTNTRKIFEAPTYERLKDDWQNLLFHGDNKDVLATLLELGFRGKIDLIYIDPPFKSGADYVRRVELRGLKNLGQIEEDEAPLLQQTMYFDIWNNDAYLQFMYERLMLLKELLTNTGSISIHLDWHVGHYVKLLMDEVFGQENFRNEIARQTVFSHSDPKQFGRNHDIILFYSKTSESIWNVQYQPYDDSYIKSAFRNIEPGTGRRRYQLVSLSGAGSGPPKFFCGKLRYPPPGRHWAGTMGKSIEELEKEGRIVISRNDVPRVKYYLDELPGKVCQSIWTDVFDPQSQSKEKLYFATQKPEALLKRIILASSNPNGLILDGFLGSGTTAAVAQKLGRRWIGVDINKGAIQTTSKRLQKIISNQLERGERDYPVFAIYKVNNYDLQLLRTEAIELAIQHIGIQRMRTDAFFDGYLGKNLVKIIDFNHPLTLLDLQLIQDELKKRPNEDRDVTIVSLGKELAVDPWIDEWNKKHPVNKIRLIELKTDKKYGNFLIHKSAEAKIEVERIDKRKTLVEIQNFISPTIVERLNIDSKLFKVKIPDFRSMIDTVLIDNNYDGKTFHIVYSDVPERKDDLVKGSYEIEVAKSKVKVAVKIIDMLGEEVISVFEV